MALVSYVLLSTLIAGLRGSFDPALLSSILSWAVFVVGLEIVILYLFKVPSPSPTTHHQTPLKTTKSNKQQTHSTSSALTPSPPFSTSSATPATNSSTSTSPFFYPRSGTAAAEQEAGSAGSSFCTFTIQTRISCFARSGTLCCLHLREAPVVWVLLAGLVAAEAGARGR